MCRNRKNRAPTARRWRGIERRQRKASLAIAREKNGKAQLYRTERSYRVVARDDLDPDQGSGTSLNSNSSGIVITLLGVS